MCVCVPPTELDIFGIILYSVLTFMATASMLVYIEECVYIYKKVPSNKKSIIIWVNGAAPVRKWDHTAGKEQNRTEIKPP